MENWSIKPGKVVNLGHQAHIVWSKDSLDMPHESIGIWTRGAYPKNLLTKLYSLINFIVNVYAICWFDIKKVTSSITNKFIFTIWLTGYKSNQLRFKELHKKKLQYNAFALLPENVLFSMVKSDEPEVREEGIKRILAIR